MLRSEKFIRTRFGDPVTALDLSRSFVCHGSAMGRLAFYNLEQQKEFVMCETSQELIRGISHSASGEDIWVSIGDFAYKRLNAYDLTVTLNDVTHEDTSLLRPICGRTFTMLYQD